MSGWAWFACGVVVGPFVFAAIFLLIAGVVALMPIPGVKRELTITRNGRIVRRLPNQPPETKETSDA